MPNEWGLTNWPPTDAPPWIDLQTSDWRTLVAEMQERGWTVDNPTGGERNKYFKDTLDSDGHSVRGIMVVSPGGARYPFAVCDDLSHLELLVLWPPYTCGSLTG